MRFSTAISALPLLAGLVAAETPAGFLPEVKDRLEVWFGTNAPITPGGMLKKSVTAVQPNIGTTEQLTGTYLLMVVDTDMRTGGATRGQVLHALIPGFKSEAKGSNGLYQLVSKETAPPLSYRGPQPPAETPAHPHNYLQLLFEQPANFAVPASMSQAIQTRINFNVTQFIAAASLKNPIKGNYWQVQSGDTS